MRTNINKKLDSNELTLYDSLPYDFADDHAEIFHKNILPGSTKRILVLPYQATICNNVEYEGRSRQEDMEIKIDKLKEQIKSAAKLAYMLYYGKNAMEYYNEDCSLTNESSRYRTVVNASNYGLWGKWYSVELGVHRGIDMNLGGRGAAIYSIFTGYVIAKTSFYVSIYNEYIDATIIYMHLQIDSSIHNVQKIKTWDTFDDLQFVLAGTLLGEQSDRQAGGIVHTHVEMYKGIYCANSNDDVIQKRWENGGGLSRPMATADGNGEMPLFLFFEGYKFSYNPYTYINRIWEMQSLVPNRREEGE